MIQHKNKVAAGLRALSAYKLPQPALFLYMEHMDVPLHDLFGIPIYPAAPQISFDESNLTDHIQFVPVWDNDLYVVRHHGALMHTYCAAYCDAPEES